jgi:O-antigen ligase
LLVSAFILSDKARIILKKSHLYYLFFLLVLLLSGVFAAVRGINPQLIFLGWLLFLQFGFVYILSSSFSENILGRLIYLFLPMSLVSLYQLFSGFKTSRLWVSSFETGLSTRVFGYLSSPNVLGIITAIITVMALSFFLKTKKIHYIVICAINLVVLFGTFSRSAWLGFILGFSLLLIVKNFKFIYFTPLMLLALISGKVRTRLFVLFKPEYLLDASLDGRLWSLDNGLYIFSKYPILGTGAGTYGGQLALQYTSPIYLEGIQNGYTALYFTDNQFLEILVQSGLIGFSAFCLFLIAALVELFHSFSKNKDIIKLGAIASILVFVVSGQFANVLEFGAVAIPVALIAGVGNA